MTVEVEDDAPEVERRVVIADWGTEPGKVAAVLREHTGMPLPEVRLLMGTVNVVVATGGHFDISPLVDALCGAGAKVKIAPVL